MGLAQADALHFNSFEAFLQFEKHSEIRYEYHDGEVFAMAGTTIVHNLLVGRMRDLIRPQFTPKGCYVLTESVKLEAIRNQYYPYPDVMLTCHELDKQERYMVRNPSLIVEVLSQSTADMDKTFKWQRYKKIPSLQYYVLVSQDEVLVEVYGRTEQPEAWLYRSFDNPTDRIDFPQLDFELYVGDVYEGVSLPPHDGA